MVVGCQSYAQAAFTPRKYSRYSFMLRSWVDPRAIVRSEVFYVNEKSSWDRTSDLPICNTAHLNYCATAVSHCRLEILKYLILTWARSRSQWPRGLRHIFSAACLLRLWVRIPPRAWVPVCCEFCVLKGRGLCDEMVTSPDESCPLWRVVVCGLQVSWMRRP